ncbi:MAG TPA: MarR family winged helix-turn-helix transcriptional regulator [Devosiaceae bacterium]|jgi:DNA-binding MarR family transcriptional regulator
MMQDEFDECLVLNTRMAARAVTRRYDVKLRPYGVTAAQFTVLISVARRPDRSVTEIAGSIAMERSTLSRNLDLLERKGLIYGHGAERGNGRLCAMTEAGSALVEVLVPQWRAMQAELRTQLAQPDLQSMVTALQQLAKL